MIDTRTLRSVFDARGPLAMLAAALIGASLLPILARSFIDHPPLYDELLHLLAARGVIETGEPAIAAGIYSRAELFTRTVALTLQGFGGDALAARIPALASAVLLIALIGAWTSRRAGWLAGTSAAVLLAMAPSSLSLAPLARFYTMHALVVSGMLIALYEALDSGNGPKARIAAGMIAVLLFPLAYHLQETSVISASAGVLAALALLVMDRSTVIAPVLGRRPLASAAIAAVAVVVCALLAWQLGLVERLSTAPLWAAERTARIGYYNSNLVADFPLLWPLMPLAAVAAIVDRRRLGVFCIVTVLAALVVHSIAAQKAMRYFYHVLPFACVIWGLGFRRAVLMLTGLIERWVPALARGAALVALALAGFTVANSVEGQRAAKLALGRGDPGDVVGYAAEADWSIALPALRPYVESVDRVVVSSAVKGLYVLGRYDYELNASVVLETESGEEFGRDPRTGRQAIGSAESVARVIAEPGTALVVIEDEKLGVDSGAPPAAVALIRSQCAAIELPEESSVNAWRCD